jgi:protocadherin-15
LCAGQHSPTNSDATTAVVGTLRRNNNLQNNNNLNLSNNINNNNNNNFNNRYNTLQRANNHINPLSNGAAGTLTLGRIKSERNNYNR